MKNTAIGYFKIPVSVTLIITGCWFLGQSAYIHAKAWLAQALIENAWSNVNHGEHQAKPWSWADTWPVARLQVPRLDIDLYVLAGDSGRTLAFGPGHNFASARPGAIGHSIISAHRDTHFSFLKDLQKNDEIIIQTPDRKISYKVDSTWITHKDQASFPREDLHSNLHLVTCYPFDTMITGGSERYIVSASAQ